MRLAPWCAAFALSFGASASAYEPPAPSAKPLAGIDFSKAAPIDEAYRAEFLSCDEHATFRGERVKPELVCGDDPNRVEALLRLANRTVMFEAKMSLDLDGSWKACHAPGASDQCPTWFNWPGREGRAAYMDSDVYPYIVIPSDDSTSGGHEFEAKTGIGVGDFAMVVYRGRAVPAIVGDGGPRNKLGEASNALFRALGLDRCRKRRKGRCTDYLEESVEGGVLYFVFPGSARHDITPKNAFGMIQREARRLFRALKR